MCQTCRTLNPANKLTSKKTKLYMNTSAIDVQSPDSTGEKKIYKLEDYKGSNHNLNDKSP